MFLLRFKRAALGPSSLVLFPGASRSFDYEALFYSTGRHADVTDLAVNHGFDSLQIRQETPFGNGGNVGTNTSTFLGFATTPNDAAFDGPFACEFTNSCHNSPLFLIESGK